MSYFLFSLLTIFCVGSIVGMIISKNQAYNALLLVLSFASLGGIFGLLDAPFIAVVQIIIYAGAIMVLFIFVIMMINLKEPLPPERKRWTLYLSGILAIVLLLEFFLALKNTFNVSTLVEGERLSSPTELGRLLFTKYLWPFEITSILIIASLVGAIVLVKKKGK